MAISLPYVRQLSDEVLRLLSDCVPFAAASWATLRSRWRNCLASPWRPSRGGGPPTLLLWL